MSDEQRRLAAGEQLQMRKLFFAGPLAAIQVEEGDGQLDIITSNLPSGSYWVVFRIGKFFGRRQVVID